MPVVIRFINLKFYPSLSAIKGGYRVLSRAERAAHVLSLNVTPAMHACNNMKCYLI